MNNLISIIIPVYNVEQYVNRCLDSIINQSYKKIEIILIDDGSSDNSGKICDKYAEIDNRIKVIHKDNGGVSSARNVGLEVATGEFLTFVDSDDYLPNNAIENLLTMKEADFVFSKAYLISNENKEIIENGIKESLYLNGKSVENDLISRFLKKDISGALWAKMYRRDIIEKNEIRFDNELDIGEDIIFNIIFCSNCVNYATVDAITYNYIINKDSVMQKYNPKTLQRINILVSKCQEIIAPLVKEDFLNEYYYFIVWQLNYVCLKYIYHTKNDISAKNKKNILKELCCQNKFKKAIEDVKIASLGYRQKLLIILIRMKLFNFISLIYKV